MRTMLMALLCLISVPVWAAEDVQSAAARSIFEKFVVLEQAYDPAVADLYADNAIITNKRVYPFGRVRELTVPADKYKALIKGAMPLAKAKGDYSTYSDLTLTQEGNAVRIKGTRFSVLKKYESPFSMLFQQSADGTWKITEEISQSQP